MQKQMRVCNIDVDNSQQLERLRLRVKVYPESQGPVFSFRFDHPNIFHFFAE